MPIVNSNGLAQIPFSSLARGFLTGKYRPGVQVESGRAMIVSARYFNYRGWKIIEKLDRIAKNKNTSVAAVALSWLRAQATVSAPIASATRVEQIRELFPIIQLTESEISYLSN